MSRPSELMTAPYRRRRDAFRLFYNGFDSDSNRVKEATEGNPISMPKSRGGPNDGRRKKKKGEKKKGNDALAAADDEYIGGQKA